MVSASATDVLVAAFAAMAAEQQEELLAELYDLQLRRVAGEESETTIFLRSLRRVAAYVGEELTPDNYRAARKELVAAGEEIIEFNRVVRHFGTWRQAKEALELSAITTPFKIEARLRARMVGKVSRYREETLRQTIADCVADLGRVPLLIEFELWRQSKVELAKARGEELFLPSDSPYRRRWGSWENALLHFGYDITEIKARLEPGRGRSTEAARRRPRQRAQSRLRGLDAAD